MSLYQIGAYKLSGIHFYEWDKAPAQDPSDEELPQVLQHHAHGKAVRLHGESECVVWEHFVHSILLHLCSDGPH